MTVVLRYTGVAVYTSPLASATWTKRGDIDPKVPVTIEITEEKSVEAFDKDGVTPQIVKYMGTKIVVKGKFKAYDKDDLGVLLHSVTSSGGFRTFGKSKAIGQTSSGVRLALKPIDTSDTSGVYIPQAVNVAELVDVFSNQEGEYRQAAFAFVALRKDGVASAAIMEQADSAASTTLTSFPT